jgi:hypothetical protein
MVIKVPSSMDKLETKVEKVLFLKKDCLQDRAVSTSDEKVLTEKNIINNVIKKFII